MTSRKRLGRGLDVLLGGRSDAVAQQPEGQGTNYVELPTGALAPGKYQPRAPIEDDSLLELADSIRQRGVLQPLVVRRIDGPDDSTRHEIVAGERRWRAARMAGLQSVPVLVYELDDQAALAIALIENLQREDLSAIEVARSLKKLTDEFGLTHQQTAEAVGRSRSSVTNLLRLLELDAEVRQLLDAGKLDMGHARALLSLKAPDQRRLAGLIVAKELSVRQAEQLVAKLSAGRPSGATARPVDMQTRWLQKQLADEAGLRVAFRNRPDGSRVLGVAFDDLEQLQTALQRIEALIGQVRETAGPRVRNEG